MRKTSVDIDDHLVEQVRDLLGTSSIKETIDRALREVVRTAARREEIRVLAAMEGLDLADERIMAGAWRSDPQTGS
ncbi:MAG: type II toxin-antitoxin system VapB family antitoxin [Acidobacteria bacterium]|nr:type II toxin-antitoxin system VapB family antitoxin [Acidobacteriota bacterium]